MIPRRQQIDHLVQMPQCRQNRFKAGRWRFWSKCIQTYRSTGYCAKSPFYRFKRHFAKSSIVIHQYQHHVACSAAIANNFTKYAVSIIAMMNDAMVCGINDGRRMIMRSPRECTAWFRQGMMTTTTKSSRRSCQQPTTFQHNSRNRNSSVSVAPATPTKRAASPLATIVVFVRWSDGNVCH